MTTGTFFFDYETNRGEDIAGISNGFFDMNIFFSEYETVCFDF